MEGLVKDGDREPKPKGQSGPQNRDQHGRFRQKTDSASAAAASGEPTTPPPAKVIMTEDSKTLDENQRRRPRPDLPVPMDANAAPEPKAMAEQMAMQLRELVTRHPDLKETVADRLGAR